MTTPGQPPTSDAEWARETEKRLRQLESPNTVRVGPWVISSQEGELVATKPGEELILGASGGGEDGITSATRGYVDTLRRDVEETFDPNGGGGIPEIKDYLSGKWDDLVEVTELADSRLKAGNNLVTNPGFEKTLFYLGNGAISSDRRRTGSRSARMDATGSTQRLYLISDVVGPIGITATAGDQYYAECWVFGEGNTQLSGGAQGMSVYIDVFDKDGTQVGQSLTMTGPTASSGLNNQWNRFYGYIKIPTTSPYTNTAYMTAYIQLNSNVTAGSVYFFDDPIVRCDSLVNSWNYIFDAANGTVGTTGKGPDDIFVPFKNVRDKAIEGASGASGALNTALAAASGAAGARQFTQDFLDSLVIAYFNLTGTEWGVSKAAQAGQNLAQSISNLNSITANLLAQAEAGMFYGNAFNEDFSGTSYSPGSILPAPWLVINSYPFNFGAGSEQWKIADVFFGFAGVRAATMRPIGANSFNRLSKARYNNRTVTKYQKIALVISNLGGVVNSRLNENNDQQVTYIYGRMSADGTRYIYARLTRSQVSLGYNNGTDQGRGEGNTDFIGGVRNYTPKSGMTYWLECGVGAQAQTTYRLWEGNTIILTAVDNALVSNNNDTDLHSGFGGYFTNGNYYPAEIGSFGVYDNVPPALRGSGFRYYNTQNYNNANAVTLAASSFVMPATGTYPRTGYFPDNWYSSADYITSDLLYSSLTNTITVSQPGWYLVTIAQKGSYTTTNSFGYWRFAAAVFRDKGSGQFLCEGIAPHVQGNNFQSFGGSFVIYAQGGDRIRPGWYATANTDNNDKRAFTGSTDLETYWSLTFLHNQLTKIDS